MKKRCEWCKKSFDVEKAEQIFDEHFDGSLNYENLHKCLCGVCASELIDDEEIGIYFETCDKCGIEFDLMEHEADFQKYSGGLRLRDYWGQGLILCSDCAIEDFEKNEGKYK